MTSRFPTAEEFASWPLPNYVDPETRCPLALGICIPMSVLVLVFISGRFYSRTVLVRALGLDDWIMLLAAIMCIANNIMIIISMLPQNQMGYHLWDIKPKRLYGKMAAAQMGMAAQLMFTTIVTLMKVAILLTYLRIFPSKANRYFCYFMLAYTISLNVSCFFVTLFQCSPASTYWEIFKYIGTAKCLNIKAIYYFHSGQNTLSDFIIFLWPAKDLLSVQISLRQRVTLISMFCLGVVVCIAGVVRIYFTHLYLVSYDVFWHGGETFIIMSIESAIGVTCGCLPGCKPIMNRMFPRVFGTTNASSRPSAQDRVKQLEASGSTQNTGSNSFPMSSLSSGDRDMVVTEKRRDLESGFGAKITALPPIPAAKQNRGDWAGVQTARRAQDADQASNASTELIIQYSKATKERDWR